VKAGKFQVSLALAPFLLLSASHDTATTLHALDLPPGFDMSIYATGLEGARGLTIDANGVLSVLTADSRMGYSIAPASGDMPVMVMLVAQDLQDVPAGIRADAVAARLLVTPGSRDDQTPPAQDDAASAVLGPDGSLFVVDEAAGVIYRIRHPAP
jgi:hypothetical protein